MISTGNDIVSFAATNFIRTKQPAFYSKILSETEIADYEVLHSSQLSFEIYVWLLWSVKESVYKYLKRLRPELIFSPARIVITQLHYAVLKLQNFDGNSLESRGFDNKSAIQGTADFGGERLHFKSSVYGNLLHSVANGTNNFDNIYWGIKTITDSSSTGQSAAVRAFALGKLQAVYGGDAFMVVKDEQDIPLIVSNDRDILLPISFSHHGRYVAYSFCLPPNQI